MPAFVADADLPEAAPADVATGPLGRLVFAVGSAGLLIAAGTDALAVLGRHVGFRLVGSIEVVQMAVVLIASAAVVGATLLRAHAAVHLLTSRLSAAAAARLAPIVSVLSAVAMAAIAAASIWIAADLWDGHEMTELLHLPIRPFRLVWAVAALVAAVVFLAQAIRRPQA